MPSCFCRHCWTGKEPVRPRRIGAAVERAFATASCCTFMQVHESAGTEWFNKECFEELLEWFSIIALMEEAATNPAPRTLSTRLGRMAAENRRMIEAATHAGYRTRLLLRLLAPAATLPAVKASSAATKGTTRKKSDVQGNTRKNSTKAPDHKVPR